MLRVSLLVAGLNLLGAAAPSQAARIPSGRQSGFTATPRASRLRHMWRSRINVRFYHDGGVYPGDGQECGWCTVRGTTFPGRIQGAETDPAQLPLTLPRSGSLMRVKGLDASLASRHESTVEHFARMVPKAGTHSDARCRTHRLLAG